jgi:hypothetical protein
MMPLITLAIIGFLFYYLFIRGVGYVLIFFAFGLFGGGTLISNHFPETKTTVMTFMQYQISWAYFIAFIISVLALGFFLSKLEDK